MPLSRSLLPVRMTLNCPACDAEIVKRGSWFQSVKSVRCEKCGHDIHLGYGDKLNLFERHAHLASCGSLLATETLQGSLAQFFFAP